MDIKIFVELVVSLLGWVFAGGGIYQLFIKKNKAGIVMVIAGILMIFHALFIFAARAILLLYSF